MVYELFNTPLPVYCGNTYLNLPPIPIGDSYIPNKISHYIPYPLPDAVYFASVNHVSTFTAPSKSLQVIILTYYDPNTRHNFMIDNPGCIRGEIIYFSGLHDVHLLYKK